MPKWVLEAYLPVNRQQIGNTHMFSIENVISYLTSGETTTNRSHCSQPLDRGPISVAKAELGIKRTCPTTGRKFYDLNKDPIVSPYTGQAYARNYFDPVSKASKAAAEKDEDDEDGIELDPAVEIVSLDEAAEGDEGKDIIVDDDIDIDADIVPDDDDTFLEEEEEDTDDVSVLIDGDIETDDDL